tara:strand:+ start:1334 stop:1891 length:558 start_codon:yes stop_codon:yes gene_type:complete
MIKFFYIYLFFNFLFSENCIEKIYRNTFSIESNQVLQIDLYGSFSNEEYNAFKNITLFINNFNNEIYIDFDNQIYMLNDNYSKIYHKDTNQMYIDHPDSIFLKKIFSFFDYDYKNNFKVNGNKYVLEKDFDLSIKFNSSCKIDELVFKNQYFKIIINEFLFNSINSELINTIIGIPNDYFEFDLR